MDPVKALTRSPYGYVAGNPLNATDPTGLWFGSDIIDTAGEVGETALHLALDAAAFPPYAKYYLSNKLAHAINSVGDELGLPGQVVAHGLNIPLAQVQAEGLCEDALIDWIKGHTVNNESIRDEGVEEYINPFHSYLPRFLRGPKSISREYMKTDRSMSNDD